MYMRAVCLLGAMSLIVTFGCSSDEPPATTDENTSKQSQTGSSNAPGSGSSSGGLVDIDQLAEATTFPFQFSVIDVTGKPIIFIGVGQEYKDLEHFEPERFTNMILK